MEKLNLILNLFVQHYDIALALFGIVYEIIARRVPSKRDYSIVNLLHRIAERYIKNRRKIQYDIPYNEKQNSKPKKKFLGLFLLLFLFTSIAYSQSNISGRLFRTYPVLSGNAADTAASASFDGHFWYDFTSHKLRMNINGTKFTVSPLPNSGGNISGTLANQEIVVGTGTNSVNSYSRFTYVDTLAGIRGILYNTQMRWHNIGNNFDNLFLGRLAGPSTNIAISQNLGIGSYALHNISVGGTNNHAIGYLSGALITTGDNNTLLGFRAGNSITTGGNITAIGANAGQLVTGNNNTLIGNDAGLAMTTGSGSVAIGDAALNGPVTGIGNTVVGQNAAQNISSGNHNTILGNGGGTTITTGSYNLVLGDDCEIATATASNQLSIQNAMYGLANSGTGNTISTGFIGFYQKAPTYQFHLTGNTADKDLFLIEEDGGNDIFSVEENSGLSEVVFNAENFTVNSAAINLVGTGQATIQSSNLVHGGSVGYYEELVTEGGAVPQVILQTQQSSVLTTNATVTTIYTIPTTSDTEIMFSAHLVARRTGGASGAAGDGAGYIFNGLYKNVAGVLSAIGVPTATVIGESQAAWDFTSSVSGTNILLRVTGAAGNNVQWTLNKLDLSVN
jgi:hypothetical protein